MKKCHAKKIVFLLNNCLANLAIFFFFFFFCMAFVFLKLIFFIDHYYAGVSDKRCLLSFFHLKLATNE